MFITASSSSSSSTRLFTPLLYFFLPVSLGWAERVKTTLSGKYILF